MSSKPMYVGALLYIVATVGAGAQQVNLDIYRQPVEWMVGGWRWVEVSDPAFALFSHTFAYLRAEAVRFTNIPEPPAFPKDEVQLYDITSSQEIVFTFPEGFKDLIDTSEEPYRTLKVDIEVAHGDARIHFIDHFPVFSYTDMGRFAIKLHNSDGDYDRLSTFLDAVDGWESGMQTPKDPEPRMISVRVYDTKVGFWDFGPKREAPIVEVSFDIAGYGYRFTDHGR